MRMWHKKLTPYLCNKHLLGAHGELHKHRHIFVQKHRIAKRILPTVQIEPSRMEAYHNELVTEMKLRKMQHQSPYKQPRVDHLKLYEQRAKVNLSENIITLVNRCKLCRKTILKALIDGKLRKRGVRWTPRRCHR